MVWYRLEKGQYLGMGVETGVGISGMGCAGVGGDSGAGSG